MSNMKCPYCNEELERDGDVIQCSDIDCRHLHNLYGSYELWQELTNTKQALEQSETCCTEWEKQALDYKAENIALSGELELTRKALDVAVDALKYIGENQTPTGKFARIILNDIKQIKESPAENVQPDTKSRPVNVQEKERIDEL